MKKLLLIFLALATFGVEAQSVPRPEYPRPQMVRNEWINLNGTWTYTLDQGLSGQAQGFAGAKSFKQNITIPFCPESKLSGVAHTDFINCIWYQRKITIPANWVDKKVLLQFGGAYYQCEAFVDSQLVATHYGGTSAFNFDLTPYVKAGSTHNLVLCIKSDVRAGTQPMGKQSFRYASSGARYTRTTGLWQTIWLEAVDKSGLKSIRITPDLDQKAFNVKATYMAENDKRLRVTLKDGNSAIEQVIIPANSYANGTLHLKQVKTWSPQSPYLYDFIFEVLDRQNRVIDKVTSYAGMRKIHIEGNRIFLNNQSTFLRFVLDQGYYPDGVWTAPTDEALKHDIELSMAAGFNGARLHQKVFEERFHYWADKLGYLVWGEAGDWGPDRNRIETQYNLLTEWRETLEQRINHPSIVGWTPLNEVWLSEENSYIRFNQDIYDLTKTLDPTRPVSTADGGLMYKTDIWSVHDYAQDSVSLTKNLTMKDGKYDFTNYHVSKYALYQGEPMFLGEYGGIKWVTDPAYKNAWGYGKGPQSAEEAIDRMRQLTNALLRLPVIGYCFTQLTNVEQEQNGIYNYDRTPKFDVKKMHAIFSKDPVK